MSKQVYISADYALDGAKEVVEELVKWGKDDKHKVDFIDMSNPSSGSVANSDDCRICDLKAEFNTQINASSAVIFVVGNKTASRTAGSACPRNSKEWYECYCTPYKQNTKGQKLCKHTSTTSATNGNVGNINTYSYLRHEFEQAEIKGKTIIIIYNSTRKESSWLPIYMNGYEDEAHPFWKYNDNHDKVGDYEYIKEVLGF